MMFCDWGSVFCDPVDNDDVGLEGGRPAAACSIVQ